MRRAVLCLSGLFMLLNLSFATSRPAPASCERWLSYIGDWEASGGGNPGQGQGHFSFAFDLQGRVLVRKSHTDYPRTGDRAAFAHDDLMVIYPGEAQNFRADYFDNEGHVIHYNAEFSADNQTVTFLSEVQGGQPRFRLTYVKLKGNTLGIKFEIAPPGKPENFKLYVEGTAHKKLSG